MKRPAPIYTNLGMHFVSVSKTAVVLVQVEVNVRGLLAVHARRLCKSKRARACVSHGVVRMSIATPESQEIAAAALNQGSAEATHTIDCLITTVQKLRGELDALRGIKAVPVPDFPAPSSQPSLCHG